jgi:predicted PurR-regulated permease PerM
MQRQYPKGVCQPIPGQTLSTLPVRPPRSFRQLLTLGFTLPVITLNIWVLWQIFLYFEQLFNLIITAAVLAFLLNYLVVWVQQWGLRRNFAIALVLVLSLALMVLLGFVLGPILITQTSQLLAGVPDWLEQGSDKLTWLQRLSQTRNLPIDIEQIKAQLETQVSSLLKELPSAAINTFNQLLYALLNTLLIFVLAGNMLFYGKKMWLGLINLLPKPWGMIVNRAAQLNFQRFFIVQLLLALFMFAATTPLLLLLQTNFALLLALIVGAAQLVPVIGATLGIGLVVLIIAFQNGILAIQVGLITVFLQQIKDNLLAPRLLGDMIGLNPLWQFIALLIGARIAGPIGIILSIPIAGTIKATFEEFRRWDSQRSKRLTRPMFRYLSKIEP